MYIVHPMWFYLYGLVGKFECLSSLFSILFGIAATISGLIYLLAKGDNDIAVSKTALSIFKPASIVFGIALTLCLFLPTQETFLRMAAASYATKENVHAMVQNGKELKDTLKSDVIDLIKAIKEK